MSPLLRLRWRPFAFTLPRAMVTAHGAWGERRGWLLRLEAPDGRLGWGEAGASPGGLAATGMAGAGSAAASGIGGFSPGGGRRGAGRARAERSGFVSTGCGKTGDGRAGVPEAGMPANGMIGSRLAVVPSGAAKAASAASVSAAARDAASPLPVASAFPEQPGPWAEGLAALAPQASRADLEACLPQLPAPLAFALGAALAELDGLVGSAEDPWRAPPPSAWLLPAGEAALEALRPLLARDGPADGTLEPGSALPGGATPWITPRITAALTVKWKVAALPDALERRVLEELLVLLPPTARLRLDANGGWDRSTAEAWVNRLAGEPRLAWLEQPLSPGDLEGLNALAQRIPVALDESLRVDPGMGDRWPGWQVRRPALEGDPRPLLAALRAGRPRLMVSTALETGIGRRWLHHLAALQAAGPTPTAPGLAPGWSPDGPLFAPDPAVVWEAAA